MLKIYCSLSFEEKSEAKLITIARFEAANNVQLEISWMTINPENTPEHDDVGR